MKLLVRCLVIIFLFAVACKKKDNGGQNTPPPQDTTTHPHDTTTHPVDTTHPAIDSFTTYTILQGNNYMQNNTYPTSALSSMHFAVIFDSSCIYTNVDPVNQLDINKLMGFADCNSFHQANSARFGWNWVNDSMRLHAYCYVGGVRQYKELTTVPLNKAQDCWLKVLNDKYIFVVNGKADTVLRGCTDAVANGYILYPYFGGDEPAPHEIHIKVRLY
jgi:hypothetical protein